MARIDEVRQKYEDVTDRLFSDKKAFEDYLRFAGKFYKLPSAQSMLIYGANPNAVMVADYGTWKKFDRQVKRDTNSIAVLDNGNLKHFFDISQTSGTKTPYQWTLDKATAAAYIEEIFDNNGKHFNSLSGCINYLGSEKARESLASVINSLNIPEENRAKFTKSYISMTQFFIAARCELGGDFKYNNKADLSALDMLHSKAEKEKLCEFVQITGKSVLLSMEKSINNIIIQGRSIENGRNQTDMVRGRSEILSRNQNGERENVQVRPDNVRVSGAVGAGSDGRGTGSDERGNRTVRGEMAGVYDGKPPRGDTVAARSAEMGTDTPSSGQRSDGVPGTVEETVRTGEPTPDNVQRAGGVGEHVGDADRQGDNGGHSADLSGLSDGERATYSTTETEQTKAEDNTPAFSVPDTKIDLPDDVDKFYVNKENESVTWVYYNPDSDKGGQLVYHHFTFDQLFDVLLNPDIALSLTNIAKTELVDIDDPAFKESAEHFLSDSEDFAFNGGDWDRYRLSAVVEPTYTILQLNDRSDLRDYRFASISELEERGLYVDRENYNRVYRRRLEDGETLETLYTKFNVNRPYDFHGHSLSVGDIIMIRRDGKATAHYVDDLGFEEIQDYFLDLDERRARRILRDNIELYAENQLASDEMDDLGDYLFRNEYHFDGLKIGENSFPFDELHKLAERYKNGEDIRNDLGRGIYGDRNIIETHDSLPNIHFSVTRNKLGMTFKTTGGSEFFYSWTQLGDAMIRAARKEFDRHEALDKAYENELVSNFKTKTAAEFVPIDGMNASEIEEKVRDYVNTVLTENEIDAQIVDLAVTGSRSRKLESDRSDLDITIEFTSELKEDALFNILHDEAFEIGGVTVDINPIRKEETGSLGYYLESAEKTIYENHEHKQTDTVSDIINGVRQGKTANIITSPELDGMIKNAYKKNISNIRLVYNEKRGFHFKGDTDTVKNATLTVFGENEKALRDDLNQYLLDKAEINLVEGENPLQFYELSNGTKIYDTSKWDNRSQNYPPVAHIYNDGTIDYFVDKSTLKATDIEDFEKEANRLKQFFIKEWDKLPIDTRFSQIEDRAVGLSKPQSEIYFADKVILGIEGIVEKYKHPLILQDVEFPAAERPLIAYPVGDFYEFYKEDAETVAVMLDIGLTERRGVPMTGFPAYAYDHNKQKLAMQGYYLIEGDVRDIEKWLTYASKTEPQIGNETLEIAKKNISDFCQSEYGEEAVFDDLHNIGIAYTTVENGEDVLELQVNADIIDCAIRYYVNDELYKEETYPDLRKMNNDALSALKFDELYAEFSDVIDEFEQRQTAELAEQTVEAAEIAQTEDKSDDKPQIVWEPVLESENDDGRITTYSTKYDGDPYWISERPDGRFDIEMQYGDRIVTLGRDFEDFVSRADAEEFFAENIESYLTHAMNSYEETNTFYEAEEQGYEQLSLFGEPIQEVDVPETTVISGIDVEEALKRELIRHGTGFEDGKFRIEAYYREHKGDTKEFAKLLEKEYGNGGHSGDGKIGFTDYDNKGLRIEIISDNGEKTKLSWSWQKIAKRIATLIDKQEYITQRDIDERIKSANYYYNRYEQGTPEHERAEKILDGYGLLPTASQIPPDQQAVSEEMSKAEYGDKTVEIPFTEQATEENTEIKLKSTVIDLKNNVIYNTDYQPPTVENSKTADTVDINPITAKLAKVFPTETAEQLYNAFENNRMDAWDSNQAKINRIKRALYDILGNEEQTERAFGIIASANQKPRDFVITDEHLGEGGAKTKYAANIAAIRTLKAIEADERLATPEEQEILAKYVGWGGLPQAFDGSNKQWENEYSELKELLTDEEYRAASGSALNAHYTTPTVINAIYMGLENLGFEGGNILEPSMGIGNFFGAMPEEMRKNSKLNGVELDSITGRIAKQLYQNADIQVKGFEKTDFSDNFFDVVVGNVPFGSYGVSDKRYNRENFFIHDYFIAKSLDKVAPNGIVALVTTKGTLDKANPKVREYLAKRADLVGAIRLPNNAFKANAGTEVTADILFFQKREKMAVEMPDWCYVSNNADGVPVNNYFIEHPEMILGEMKQGMEFSLYGNSEETACVPLEGADLKEQLEKAVGNLKINNALRIHNEQRQQQAGVIPATTDVRNFTFAEVDGKMYFRENNIMTEAADKNGQPLTGKKLDRLKALNELRKTFRTILKEQENDCSDEQLKAYQKILNEQYDTFVKNYGYINDSANFQAFGKDDDYNSLCALEVIDEETKTVTKSDFFRERTIKHFTEITHVENPQEALNVSIDTLGKLDFEYMGKLCGKEPLEVINELRADNLIYLNPNKANPENPLEGWEEASEYLSGNVRVKLKDAEAAAKDNPDYQRNVEALTAVIPQRIEAGDITARIGVHWVDVADYQRFMEEYAQAHFFAPLRRNHNGEYKIEHKSWNNTTAGKQIFGTKRMNSLEIFENLLNNRDVVVRDKIIDSFSGKERYVLNVTETQKAQDKADKMKAAFARWLWDDPERREKYVTRYNELFNSLVGRKYDGSHQTFPGMNPYIKLKPHQLDAIARAKFGGNTLLAHCVGAGKSFEMVAITMEKKRLGLINKACVVVPKSLVGQMASEWLRLYPQAKILTATEKDFDKDHRQKFIGRCCTGEYDAVIMSYEQFEKIPMSFEYRRDFIKREIESLTAGISDLSSSYISRQENRGSIKDMERTRKRLEAKLEKLIEDNGKTKDTSLTFEQLGFDSLVVDEAHNYKNGLVVTKMNRVAGVQTTPAQKSEDILMKTQYLNENYGERNIVFATGTPVSNSMTELYIMTRYMRPSLLALAGLQTFDDWASTFGEVVSKAELKPAGNGYRTKKRFAKFNNLPELMAMYKEFADIRTADMLDLPVPKIEGGKPQTIVATPNDFQVAAMKILAQRSERVHLGAVDPTEDNMLKITGEARLLGLDARCLNPEADNYPDSKVNLCINKVMEIYTQTTAQKGVQAIFCDIAVNGDNEQEELGEDKPVKKQKIQIDTEDEGKFSVYNYIKAELIRRGVPKDEICFAGDADTQKKQNEMRALLRSGTKRIVIASTSKLGTGANIQNKLVALHNLDIPWKPSDLEQRLGRIVRQGNENDTVQLYNYVTKDTFDAYMMNIIVTKQKFISQLMSGKTTARSCEDVDEMVLNYTEMQALATGDPRIKEKIELDTDVARLKMLESEHYNEQYRLDDTISKAQIAIRNYERGIEGAKKDVEFAQQNPLSTELFKVEIGGKLYVDRKEAGTALRQAAVSFLAKAAGNGTIHQPIGTFRGFELALEKGIDASGGVYAMIAVRHEITYTASLDIMGDIGNAARLENLVNDGIGKKLADMEKKCEQARGDLQAALDNKGKPFEHAEELAEKSARLNQLNIELEVGKVDEVIMDESEDEERKSPKHDTPDKDLGKPKPPSHGRR